MVVKVIFIRLVSVIMIILLEENVDAIVELEQKTELWNESKPDYFSIFLKGFLYVLIKFLLLHYIFLLHLKKH
jgi:hypothetical protein